MCACQASCGGVAARGIIDVVGLCEAHRWHVSEPDNLMDQVVANILIPVRILKLTHMQLVHVLRVLQGTKVEGDMREEVQAWMCEQMAGVMREGVPGPGVRPQQALAVAREAWAIALLTLREKGPESPVVIAARAHAQALAAVVGKAGGGSKGKSSCEATMTSPATLPGNPVERMSRICNSHLVRAMLAWQHTACSELLVMNREVTARAVQLVREKECAGAGAGQAAGATDAHQGEQHASASSADAGVACPGSAQANPCSGGDSGGCGAVLAHAQAGQSGARKRSGWAALTMEQRLVVVDWQVGSLADRCLASWSPCMAKQALPHSCVCACTAWRCATTSHGQTSWPHLHGNSRMEALHNVNAATTMHPCMT